MMAVASPLLLATNVLVHLIRSDTLGQRVRDAYAPVLAEPIPLVCIVSEGELRSLAYQIGWGRVKADQALFYLSYFRRVTIDDPEVYEAYAALDAYSLSMGRAMGKNDL